MSVIVTALAPPVAEAQWPRLRAMIDIGYAVGGELMPEDMLERIARGDILIWVALDASDGKVLAAMTTELVRMRAGLVCWMGQCGGERMQEWARFHVKIEEYAKAEGCVKVILKGRFGWERVLEGYKVRTVTLEKALT